MQAKISPRIYCTKKQRSDLNKIPTYGYLSLIDYSTHAWRIISEMSRATEITTSRPGDVTNARDSLKIHSKQCWIW